MKYEAKVEFERLAKTISEWFAPIIRVLSFTKNNGKLLSEDDANPATGVRV